MRQRRLRNLDAKYEAYEDIIVSDPSGMRGKVGVNCQRKTDIYEIGCGKGKFISR